MSGNKRKTDSNSNPPANKRQKKGNVDEIAHCKDLLLQKTSAYLSQEEKQELTLLLGEKDQKLALLAGARPAVQLLFQENRQPPLAILKLIIEHKAPGQAVPLYRLFLKHNINLLDRDIEFSFKHEKEPIGKFGEFVTRCQIVDALQQPLSKEIIKTLKHLEIGQAHLEQLIKSGIWGTGIIFEKESEVYIPHVPPMTVLNTLIAESLLEDPAIIAVVINFWKILDTSLPRKFSGLSRESPGLAGDLYANLAASLVYCKKEGLLDETSRSFLEKTPILGLVDSLKRIEEKLKEGVVDFKLLLCVVAAAESRPVVTPNFCVPEECSPKPVAYFRRSYLDKLVDLYLFLSQHLDRESFLNLQIIFSTGPKTLPKLCDFHEACQLLVHHNKLNYETLERILHLEHPLLGAACILSIPAHDLLKFPLIDVDKKIRQRSFFSSQNPDYLLEDSPAAKIFTLLSNHYQTGVPSQYTSKLTVLTAPFNRAKCLLETRAHYLTLLNDLQLLTSEYINAILEGNDSAALENIHEKFVQRFVLNAALNADIKGKEAIARLYLYTVCFILEKRKIEVTENTITTLWQAIIGMMAQSDAQSGVLYSTLNNALVRINMLVQNRLATINNVVKMFSTYQAFHFALALQREYQNPDVIKLLRYYFTIHMTEDLFKIEKLRNGITQLCIELDCNTSENKDTLDGHFKRIGSNPLNIQEEFLATLQKGLQTLKDQHGRLAGLSFKGILSRISHGHATDIKNLERFFQITTVLQENGLLKEDNQLKILDRIDFSCYTYNDLNHSNALFVLTYLSEKNQLNQSSLDAVFGQPNSLWVASFSLLQGEMPQGYTITRLQQQLDEKTGSLLQAPGAFYDLTRIFIWLWEIDKIHPVLFKLAALIPFLAVKEISDLASLWQCFIRKSYHPQGIGPSLPIFLQFVVEECYQCIPDKLEELPGKVKNFSEVEPWLNSQNSDSLNRKCMVFLSNHAENLDLALQFADKYPDFFNSNMEKIVIPKKVLALLIAEAEKNRDWHVLKSLTAANMNKLLRTMKGSSKDDVIEDLFAEFLLANNFSGGKVIAEEIREKIRATEPSKKSDFGWAMVLLQNIEAKLHKINWQKYLMDSRNPLAIAEGIQYLAANNRATPNNCELIVSCIADKKPVAVAQALVHLYEKNILTVLNEEDSIYKKYLIRGIKEPMDIAKAIGVLAEHRILTVPNCELICDGASDINAIIKALIILHGKNKSNPLPNSLGPHLLACQEAWLKSESIGLVIDIIYKLRWGLSNLERQNRIEDITTFSKFLLAQVDKQMLADLDAILKRYGNLFNENAIVSLTALTKIAQLKYIIPVLDVLSLSNVLTANDVATLLKDVVIMSEDLKKANDEARKKIEKRSLYYRALVLAIGGRRKPFAGKLTREMLSVLSHELERFVDSDDGFDRLKKNTTASGYDKLVQDFAKGFIKKYTIKKMILPPADLQSTHKAVVHATASHIAMQYSALYKEQIKDKEKLLQEIISMIEENFTSTVAQPIQRWVRDIFLPNNSNGNYKDRRSEIILQDMLLFTYCASKDFARRTPEYKDGTQETITKFFCNALYENVFQYAMPAETDVIASPTPKPTCASGAFNVFAFCLQGIHVECVLDPHAATDTNENFFQQIWPMTLAVLAEHFRQYARQNEATRKQILEWIEGIKTNEMGIDRELWKSDAFTEIREAIQAQVKERFPATCAWYENEGKFEENAMAGFAYGIFEERELRSLQEQVEACVDTSNKASSPASNIMSLFGSSGATRMRGEKMEIDEGEEEEVRRDDSNDSSSSSSSDRGIGRRP